MANPRTTSDLWDDSDQGPHYLDDEVPHYPKLTPRRVALAHALGVLGVLGTLGLAIAAFAPRMSGGIHSLRSVLPQEDTLSAQPRAATQAQPPTAAPPETAAPAVPAPVVSPTVEPSAAPVGPATSNPTTMTPSTDNATSPSATSQATATSTPALVTPPASEQSQAAPNQATATAPSIGPATSPSAATTPPAVATKSLASQARPHARPEPRLSWAEIQRRKERYAEWLKEQHLEPVH